MAKGSGVEGGGGVKVGRQAVGTVADGLKNLHVGSEGQEGQDSNNRWVRYALIWKLNIFLN